MLCYKLLHPVLQEVTPPLIESCMTLAREPAGILGVHAQLELSFWFPHLGRRGVKWRLDQQ